MKLLDLVNYVLYQMSEYAVTSVSVRHPTVAKILQTEKNEREALLSSGWYFNEARTTMHPDSQNSKIALSDDILHLNACSFTGIRRQGFLFNLDKQTYLFDKPVELDLTWNIEYEDLPAPAKVFIQNKTALVVYMADFGEDQITARLTAQMNDALIELQALELRKRAYNNLRTRATVNFITAMKG